MKHRIHILIYLALIVTACLFFSEHPYFLHFVLGVSLISFVILSLGVLFMRFNYFLPSKIHTKNSTCVLTFDDGPHPKFTPQILDILKKENVKAVFFVIGEKAKKQPELISRIVKEGHIIGNHSHFHNNFMSLYSKSKLRSEINLVQDTLESLTSTKPTFFRPPIGYTNPNYAKVLSELKLTCVGWSFRSYDSVYKDSAKLTKRLIRRIKSGQIILLHDNLEVTANSLEEFIVTSKRNGIIFASSENINISIND